MPPIPIHKDSPIQPTNTTTTDTPPSTANPPPTRTIPAPVPATTTTTSSNPPAPQPGARPAPPTASAAQPSGPPAPQPGHGYTAVHTTTETRLTSPPQFSVPPPSDSQRAGRSTTTATTASKPGPTTLNLGPVSSARQAEHAGGAVPGERRSLEHPPGYVQAADNSPYGAGGGAGASHGSGSVGTDGDGSVGSAAWDMLTKAGEALKKGEEAAWRAVRNK